MPHSWQRPKSFSHGLELIEKSLPWLDFSDMKITNDQLGEIFTAAEKRDGIVKLRLNENLIGDPGAVLAADYIAKTSCLEEIELSKNSITCKGVQAICEALESNLSLIKLTLAKNHIKDEGAQMLAEAIAVHKSITYVKVDSNYVTELSITAFARALNRNPNIIYLHFNCPSIRNEERLNQIEKLLKRNKELKYEQQRKQQDLLRNLNVAYKAKGPWRRSRLMVIGEGRTGKTALVRSLMDKPFNPQLESTVVGEVTEINVRSRGWDKVGEDAIPVDHSMALAMSIVGNQVTVDYKREKVYKEEQKKVEQEKAERQAEIAKAEYEEQRVEEFKKNPAKFRKLSAPKKRELRAMMQRVKHRAAAKKHPKTGPISLKPKPVEKPLEAPVLEKKEIIDLSVFPSLDEKEEEEEKEPEVKISAEEFRRLPPAEKKVWREKMKAQKAKGKPKTVQILNQTQLNGLLNNGEAFRTVAKGLPKLKFSVWDLGGQDVFHTVHHLFVTNYALFVLVFDMRQFTRKEVGEEVKEHISHWVSTLNLHAPDCDLVVAGTFLDEVEVETFEEDKDINKVLKDVESKLSLCLSGFSKDRVVKNEKQDLIFFPIDNRHRNGVVQLKRALEARGERQKFINLQVEIRWLSILDDLLNLNQQRLKNVKGDVKTTDEIVEDLVPPPAPPQEPIPNPAQAPVPIPGLMPGPGFGGPQLMPTFQGTGTSMNQLVEQMKKKRYELFTGWVPFKEVHKRAKRMGVTDVSEIVRMLGLFHKLGALFYLDSCQALMDVVTLDVAWLIQAIGKVIRDPELHKQRLKEEKEEIEKLNLQKDAEVMLSRGIVSVDLLQFFWGRKENSKFLLELLQKTLLISPWDKDNFLIPSLLPKEPTLEEKARKQLLSLEPFRADFVFADQGAPEGIFERLLCLMISIRERNDDLSKIRIHRSLCKLSLSKNNEVWVLNHGTKVSIAFENAEFGSYNRQMLDKMLLKIKSELSLHSFSWQILLQDRESGDFLPLEKAKSVALDPWFSGKTEESGNVDLSGFLDGI